MDLYFLICGTLAILISFGVFESVLKINKLNRFLLSIFLILSCVFDAIKAINILGVNVSLNLILYFVMFVVLFAMQKSIKGIIATILTSLIIISVLACYNAINLEMFEYAYVKPFVYIAIIVGIILYYICPNINSVFCGTLLGAILFELIFHQMSWNYVNQTLNLGGDVAITFTFVCVLSYCLFNSLVLGIKYLKTKKQEKIKT